MRYNLAESCSLLIDLIFAVLRPSLDNSITVSSLFFSNASMQHHRSIFREAEPQETCPLKVSIEAEAAWHTKRREVEVSSAKLPCEWSASLKFVSTRSRKLTPALCSSYTTQIYKYLMKTCVTAIQIYRTLFPRKPHEHSDSLVMSLQSPAAYWRCSSPSSA